ncbi:MAG: arsenic transporter, partial [Burkholderiaceae bacterium]
LGAAVLCVTGVLRPDEAAAAVGKGTEVYLFLAGMMLIAELARITGLFDRIAAIAVAHSRGSPRRLFFLIYAVGVVVTTFLSNDATAVVLTPAVCAAVKAARARDPLPYLFVCAFVANAASFVLPISNPANLVIYGADLPALGQWLLHFGLPSLIAVGVTCAVLYRLHRPALSGAIETAVPASPLSPEGRTTLAGIAVMSVVLVAASFAGRDLGWPTVVAGAGTWLLASRRNPRLFGATLRGVSWSVLPLVAGLFVLVAGLEKVGASSAIGGWLRALHGSGAAAWASGIAVALVSNVVNNLPAGLMAASVLHATAVPEAVRSAVLVGIDLGPNLSVTGSLATILWLAALRREGIEIGAWTFFKTGALVMIPSLLLALAALPS